MSKTTPSNYERLCAEWAQRISGMDISALIKRVPGLKVENDFLTLYHFGKKYGLDLSGFSISAMEDDLPVTQNARLNIYTLLWYCKPDARQSGVFKPFESLRGAGPFGPAFKKGVLQPFAAAFSGNTEKLKAAFETLGGAKLSVSDVGYQFNAFECMPVQFYFWDGDDEFPAQANILFDDSCTDFIHVESIVTIATEGVRRIAQVAGICLDRRAF